MGSEEGRGSHYSQLSTHWGQGHSRLYQIASNSWKHRWPSGLQNKTRHECAKGFKMLTESSQNECTLYIEQI